MEAINPYNDRNAKAAALVKVLEEKLTPAELEFQETHQQLLEAFRLKQAGLRLPQSILDRLQSGAPAGESLVGEVAATLLEHPESFERVLVRLTGFMPSSAGITQMKEGLIPLLQETAPRLAQEYSAAAAAIPANLRELSLAQNAMTEEWFWSETYDRYLLRERIPWILEINRVQNRLEAALSQFRRDSEVGSRLATQYLNTVEEEHPNDQR